MASSMDFFRKLGAGAKFDLKRFQRDAEKIHIKKVSQQKSAKHVHASLDFFNSPGKRNQQGTTDDLEGIKEKDEIEDERVNTSVKRKQNPQGLKTESQTVKKSKLPPETIELLRQEKINSTRKKNKIHFEGTDVPEPVTDFQQLQQEYCVHGNILRNIAQSGYEKPTPIQMQVLPVMLNRREVLACAPTGSGKTAAFIIPILAHLQKSRGKGIKAVVVSPTRELAQQTYREFERLAEGQELKIKVLDKIQTMNKSAKLICDILVCTPNRLVFMLKEETQSLKLKNVEWLIIDESDKLFEEGKSGFREQLAVIYKACDSCHVRRSLFSATFAYDVEQWCKMNLDNVVAVTVGQKNTATDTIKQELTFVGTEYGKLLAIRNIFRKGFEPPVLMFVQSKDRAKELFNELVYDGLNVDVIHADRPQQQRDEVVKNFRSGKIWVLIATELMGRGIDFKGVNLVINYDFPTSAVSYIHRIGRTGRAGRNGTAITFFTENDLAHLRSIANVMRNAGCEVPEYMLQIKKTSKREKKRLERNPVERTTIRTLPKKDLKKARWKREIIKQKLAKKQNHGSKPSIAAHAGESAAGKKETITKMNKHPNALKHSKTIKKAQIHRKKSNEVHKKEEKGT
ncbi:probable ATP-dependent RNA helicase DDX52 [Anneissia japonica]|uniref:probable ATP-dependent RNA helicase DDX52 n=1 Tax=Anneissia japonica TaxID=1529436 RepID=UPI0014255888|nr:probable ATP-dependent RNA helicase DDX52 [Anneissia japonica]